MDENEVFAVEELEARFEMETLVTGSHDVLPDWTCKCEFSSK